jgi:hypothetical protein
MVRSPAGAVAGMLMVVELELDVEFAARLEAEAAVEDMVNLARSR